MGFTTHSYGLYDPQLWAVEYLLTIGKISARKMENIPARRIKVLLWGKIVFVGVKESL